MRRPKTYDAVSSAKAKERMMLDDNHQVRLFSVAGMRGQQEAELRATAALLSVLTMVRPLSRRLLGPLGASKADRATVEAWTEVPYETAGGETLRPDGVVRVTSGSHMFTALVEVKTGDSPQELGQIEKYLKLARAKSYDCLITISGEVAPFDGAHPTLGADSLRAGAVKLHHLSWTRILAEAVQQVTHHGVDDEEQAWIAAELIRYLEHPNSGVAQASDMGENWVGVRDNARDGLLGKPGPEVLDVCRRWDQLMHSTAMRLGAELGIDVREVIPKAQRDDPSLRSKSLAAQLCDSGVLQGRLRVPGTVGDISVTADLRAARTVVAVECPVPLDKGGKGRIGWLVRQLRDAPNTITVEAFTRNSPAAEIASLADLREDASVVLRSRDKPPVKFRVSHRTETGQGRRTRTVRNLGFADSVVDAIDDFYGNVVQHMRSPAPAPPKMAAAPVSNEVADSDSGRTPSESSAPTPG